MVPVKQSKIHTESRNGNCLAAALASLLEIPLHAVPQFEEMERGTRKPALDQWLSLLGLERVTSTEPPFGPAIATGTTERGILHCIVVHNGQFEHDPHPSNSFLQSVKEYWSIVPRNT